MKKTKIKWRNATWNPVTGCLNCGTMMLVDADNVSKDELGICYTRQKCGGSFDVIKKQEI